MGTSKTIIPIIMNFFQLHSHLFKLIPLKKKFNSNRNNYIYNRFYNYQRFMNKVHDPVTNTITINPADDKHSATIVLMHGLGDSASGWESTADMLADQMPHIKFILPTAANRPISLNMGMSMPGWYDIKSLGPDKHLDPCDGIEDSRQIILDILEKEHVEVGMPYHRMLLAGFSQGGAMSLYTGLQLPIEKKLAGLAIMSGYLANHTKLVPSEGMESVDILHCHGKDDPMVNHEYAKMGFDLLKSKGFHGYSLKSYDNLGHSVNNAVLRDVFNFLNEKLPPLSSEERKAILKPLPPKEFKDMSVKELKVAVGKAGLTSKCIGFSEKRDFVELLQQHYGAAHVV